MTTLMRNHHDSATAYMMARFADAAYGEPDEVAQSVHTLAVDHFDGLPFSVRSFDIPDTGTQCFIAASADFAVVSFRGTEPSRLQDLLTDANFVRVAGGPYGSKRSRVHRGFWKALYSVVHDEQGFLDFLHDATSQGQPLFITGHSMGGALATLLAAYLSNGHWPQMTVYTFGSPRCGNSGFATLFDQLVKHCWRYVHDNDLYSRFPWQFGRFRHVGQLCYLASDGVLQVDPPFWNFYWDRYRSLFGGLILFVADGHFDHSSAKYVAACAAQTGRLS